MTVDNLDGEKYQPVYDYFKDETLKRPIRKLPTPPEKLILKQDLQLPRSSMFSITTVDSNCKSPLQSSYQSSVLSSPTCIYSPSLVTSNGRPKETYPMMEPINSNHDNPSSLGISRARYWLFNRNIMWVLFYVYLQAILFISYFLYYQYSPLYRTMRSVTKGGLPFARGAAGALYFNCSFIFLIMCRRSLGFLSRVRFIRNVFFIDSYKELHIWTACSIIFFAIFHVSAHAWNFYQISISENTSWAKLYFLSNVGMTGFIALISLTLISVGSALKHLKYEFLTYSHYLMVPFAAALLFHGTFCFIKRDAENQCASASYWKFSIFPLCLYFVERLYFEIMPRFSSATVHQIIQHPGEILELQFNHSFLYGETGWSFKPGQYVFINIPKLSKLQWHPFTLTSAPEDSFMSVFIKDNGDWTGKLHKSMEEYTQISLNEKTSIDIVGKLNVSAAYFAPADRVFDYRVSLLIGCGVGITPYISIMKAIKYRSSGTLGMKNMQKVYLIWTCRDMKQFECLIYFLRILEEEGLDSIVDITLYWTVKSVRPSMCLDMHYSANDNRDPVTGLRAKTYFGRPKWKAILSRLGKDHIQEDRVGVFFCGPQKLSDELMLLSSDMTQHNGPILDYFPEIF